MNCRSCFFYNSVTNITILLNFVTGAFYYNDRGLSTDFSGWGRVAKKEPPQNKEFSLFCSGLHAFTRQVFLFPEKVPWFLAIFFYHFLFKIKHIINYIDEFYKSAWAV